MRGFDSCYGDHLIFEDISLTLLPAERLALIGENGSGKTTLLRWITGLEPPDSGQIERPGTLAYLPQHAPQVGDSVLGAVTPPELVAAGQTMYAASLHLTDPAPEHMKAFSAAEETYRALGGYDFETRATDVLGGLNPDAQTSIHQLSGGQTRRALPARLLRSPAELYPLDEPTNHLDVWAIEALESLLHRFPGTLLLATHDRRLRERVATRVWEVGSGRVREG